MGVSYAGFIRVILQITALSLNQRGWEGRVVLDFFRNVEADGILADQVTVKIQPRG